VAYGRPGQFEAGEVRECILIKHVYSHFWLYILEIAKKVSKCGFLKKKPSN